jgi:molybdopterin synthase catalytic subunit
VSFTGMIRDHDHGRGVLELEYTGHPSAEIIGDITDDVVRRYDDVVRRYDQCVGPVSHRLGTLFSAMRRWSSLSAHRTAPHRTAARRSRRARISSRPSRTGFGALSSIRQSRSWFAAVAGRTDR